MSSKKISIAEILLWLFAVVLILLSLTPYLMGYKIKSDYAQLLADLSESSQIKISLVNYERGVFTSNAVVSLSLDGLPEALEFKEEIIHGPIYLGLLNQGKSPLVAAVIKGQLDISAAQKQAIEFFFNGKNPFTYQEIIHFTGDVEAQAYIPATNAQYQDALGQVYVQSAGLILNQYYTSSNQHMKGDINLPEFKYSSPLLTLNSEALNLSYSGALSADNILIGDSVVTLRLLDIDSKDEQFALRGLNVSSMSQQNSDLVNTGIQISAREILASNQKFGPFQLNLSLNGLNAQSLSQLQQVQQDLNDKLLQGSSPEQLNAMMMGQVMALLPDLIKQAEIKINPLSINSELGQLQADMDFKLEGVDQNAPVDPMFLLGAISLELNLSVDKPLLNQLISWQLEAEQATLDAPQVEGLSSTDMHKLIAVNIENLMNENWIVQTDKAFVCNISMHKGEFMLNGKETDPMQQLMSSMQADSKH